jgi:type II secretory pathway pseudopilin PulG
MVGAGVAPARGRGFTYLGLLLVVLLIGLTLATVGEVWSTQARRERETQLLFVGDQYRRAIARYYADGRRYPQALADLLLDGRFPQVHRQLRRLYVDPMTGRDDWQLIPSGDGGIMGVASSSQQKPIKVANFPAADAAFVDQDCYCAWQFIYRPARGTHARPSLVPPAPPPGT